VNPVVAVALGAVLLGESITPTTLLAGASIVAAVVLIVSGREPKPRVAAATARATA
jgi:drug/metabolite transporter (DMT)-like permease